jgi:hypothetical protein
VTGVSLPPCYRTKTTDALGSDSHNYSPCSVSEAVDDLALNRQTSITVGKGEAMSNISELAAKILERRRVLDRTFNDDLRRMRRRFGDHVVVLALAEMHRLFKLSTPRHLKCQMPPASQAGVFCFRGRFAESPT